MTFHVKNDSNTNINMKKKNFSPATITFRLGFSSSFQRAIASSIPFIGTCAPKVSFSQWSLLVPLAEERVVFRSPFIFLGQTRDGCARRWTTAMAGRSLRPRPEAAASSTSSAPPRHRIHRTASILVSSCFFIGFRPWTECT